MKERLKLLADKAGQLQLATPDNSSADEIMVLIGPNIEKFAELIVRECAELMYGRDENGNCKDGDTIKKHFGVEE